MTSELRPPMEVWRSAYEAWCDPPPHLAFSEAAAAIIEADRAEVARLTEQRVVEGIVAWANWAGLFDVADAISDGDWKQ